MMFDGYFTQQDDVLENKLGITDPAEMKQAEAAIVEALPALAAAGAQVVGQEGYSYPVTASLVHDYWFPTKTYTDFALPAGAYTALRIEIGAGGGQNWWCVVFPPLCLGSVSETTQETALEAGLTENQVSLMTGEDEGYVVKFKAVELLEQFKGWLEGR